jgi:hypothetical protein
MKTLPENILRRMDAKDRLPLSKGFKTSAEATEAFEVRSERELQNQIANYLRQRGLVFCQPAYGRKIHIRIGWPDFTTVVRGRFVGIEAKAIGGRLTPEQSAVHKSLVEQGATILVATSLKQVKECLDAIGMYDDQPGVKVSIEEAR